MGNHQGLHHNRTNDPLNYEERRFAQAWARENEPPKRLLEYLMSVDNKGVETSDRDQLVAATVVQWLGSPVGQYFLHELGYVRDRDLGGV